MYTLTYTVNGKRITDTCQSRNGARLVHRLFADKHTVGFVVKTGGKRREFLYA